MNKKAIATILKNGTAKKRIKLIAEDVARGRLGEDRLLTKGDFTALSDTFVKPAEVRLYNRYMSLDKTFIHAFNILQLNKQTFLINVSNLRGYIFLWDALQETEIMGNLILQEIPEEERKAISKRVTEQTRFMFTDTKVDPEGFLDIDVEDTNIEDKRYRLTFLMDNVRKQVVDSARIYISQEKALQDFIADNDFKVKTYIDMLEKLTDGIYATHLGWTKYLAEVAGFIPDIPHLRADKLKDKYALFPDITAIDVDPEIYEDFKRDHLNE